MQIGSVKLNFGVIIGILIIVAAVYFTLDAIATQSHSGNEMTITTSGVVTLTNNTNMPVDMLATNRTAFTIQTTGADNRTVRAVREGTGSTAFYQVELQAPEGKTAFKITRGSNVELKFAGEGPLSAVVAARDTEGNRNIVLFAGAISLAALFYISSATGHSWVGNLRKRVTQRGGNTAGDMSVSRT